MQIHGCDLEQTCGACPEQYEVYLGSVHVGYLRLRHGHFTAEYPDCGGALVYEAEPNGDGIFEPDERDGYLKAAVEALMKQHAIAFMHQKHAEDQQAAEAEADAWHSQHD